MWTGVGFGAAVKAWAADSEVSHAGEYEEEDEDTKIGVWDLRR